MAVPEATRAQRAPASTGADGPSTTSSGRSSGTGSSAGSTVLARTATKRAAGTSARTRRAVSTKAPQWARSSPERLPGISATTGSSGGSARRWPATRSTSGWPTCSTATPSAAYSAGSKGSRVNIRSTRRARVRNRPRRQAQTWGDT